MNWKNSLASLLSRYPDLAAPEAFPENEAAEVAQQFFVQEVYPRFQRVFSDLQTAGFDACILPATLPPEGAIWHNKTVTVRVFRRHESVREVPPLASAEVTYRLTLLCDTVVHTREGRMNQGVFILDGEPVQHIEEVIQALKNNLSLGG